MTAVTIRGATRLLLCLSVLSLGACSVIKPSSVEEPPVSRSGLYPGESPEMRALIEEYAGVHDIPSELLHRIIQRESDYNARARNGPYYGLMQILPETARNMGFQGSPSDLLDAETNLRYAGRYLRGAWLVSNGDIDAAVGWYARGYYYEARNRCMLVETGLRTREVRSACG